MKHAIVLTYDFPPCSAPGAAVRSQKLVQYLPEFGWDTCVICRDEGISGPGEKQPGAQPRVVRVRTPIPAQISYQLGAWGWAVQILAHARAVIRESRPDLIYASCPPFPHALSAVRLAHEAGIPVVVDFRDSWSLDPHLSDGVIKQAAKLALCQWIYPRFERRVIKSADAVVVNTPSMLRAYARKFAGIIETPEQETPEQETAGRRFHLVPNGFDEADFCDPIERPVRERPLLVYCGRFSGVAGRSPEVLLRAMRTVIDAGCRVDLEIIGDDSETLRRVIRRCGVEGSTRTHAAVSNREAIRASCEADILVVCQPPSRNGVTPVAGKTFEYLRSGRPILAIVPAGDNAEIVRRYAAVHAVVTTGDPASVATAIQDLLERGRGVTNWAPNPQFVEEYNRRRIAQRIAAIFDGATQARSRANVDAMRC